MSVEITVNWHFIGDDEDVQLSYSTSGPNGGAAAEHDDERSEDEFPFLGNVVPLTSSVLAPGLSMPLAAD